MFERFTDRARRVIGLALEEARYLGHNFIGTEHILLGLVDERDGVAGRVLTAAGLTVEGVRDEVRRIVGTPAISDAEALKSIGIDLDEVLATVSASFGEDALQLSHGRARRRLLPGAPPFTPRTKKVLELSLREALSLKHNYIGTEHLLLGIVREGQGVAAEILKRLAPGVDVRAAVLEAIPRPGA